MTAPPGPVTWLILVYRLPAHSGLMAVIRRKATALGAVYPANAIAALPASAAAERAFRRLRNTIGEGGGSAEVLRAAAVEGGPDLIAAFNAARDREYSEIIAGCGEIVARIEAMTAAGHFRYHDLGEMDTELKGLSVRTGTIRARDTLGAPNGGGALSALARCRAVLDGFARRVYETDTLSATGTGRDPAATLNWGKRRRGSPGTRKCRQRSLPGTVKAGGDHG